MTSATSASSRSSQRRRSRRKAKHLTTLFPFACSHDRHRILDDFQKPVCRIETRRRRPYSASVSSSLSTGSLATGNILKGAKPADLPVRQVMLIASTELND
jgi:hypothetical protein